MTILTLFLGEKGDAGTDGINGLSPEDVQTGKLDAPIYDVLKSNKLSDAGSINFSRGSLASYENRHHKNVWARSSSTTNYVLSSEDFSQWSHPVFDSWSVIGATTDPFGGSLATEINLDLDTDSLVAVGEVMIRSLPSPIPTGGNLTVSFWFKVISGTLTDVEIGTDTINHGSMDKAPTGSYQRLQKTINSTNDGFVFSINPRGSAGARFAIYGVQVENNNSSTEYIKTELAPVTVAFNGEIERESDKGWLIEEEKENIVHFSGDLSRWDKTNVTIAPFAGKDPFGVTGENISFVWGSIAEVSISTSTETVLPLTSYTVSMWTNVAAGSLTELKVSLGGGDYVVLPNPSVVGFTRVSFDIVSGNSSGIEIVATSTSLNAQLNISGVQVESGNLTSYIKTGTKGQTRLADVVTCDSAFNIPKPSNPWSFVFRHRGTLNNADKKYIFTNDQTGTDEFSCYFTNDILSLKNGASSVDVSGLLFEKIAITFDGAALKIYNEASLVTESVITPSRFISTTFYIGMDSLKANAINSSLSYFTFYDTELSLNEIIYEMGA